MFGTSPPGINTSSFSGMSAVAELGGGRTMSWSWEATKAPQVQAPHTRSAREERIADVTESMLAMVVRVLCANPIKLCAR